MGIFYQHRTSLEWSRVEICRLGFTRSVFLILSVLLLFHTSYSRELQFFHITDLHVDNLYSVDGSISERCHIPKNGNLSGEKLGPGGNYSCDPPILLIESALVYMKSINPDPDFIIWTGDSNPHWIEGPDFGYIFSNLKNLTKLFRKYFPDTMIVPTLGNHDTDPPDQYVDYSVSQEEATQFYSRYLEEGAWGEMIPKESWETFKRCGFYSFNHPLPSKNGGSDEDSSSSIKFVALNTNLYYHNKLQLNLTDPCGQLSWMDEELRMAKRNENIFILSHVPPGHFERNPREPLFTIPTGQELTKRFVDIVTERSTASKITAHFYGHTHTDTFRLFMKNGDAAGVAYVAPSITPSLWLENKAYGVNPGFRMFSYESDTDTVLDYQQYYLPLDQVGYLHEKAFIDRSSRNSKRLKWRRRKREDTGQEIDASTELSADPDITTKKEEVVSDSEIERPDGDEATTVKAPSKDSESLATTIKPPQGEENQRDGEILTTLSPVSEDITTTINSSVNQDQPAEIEHVVTTAAPKAPRTPLDLLVSKWKFGYNATTALNITNLSIKQMHMAYLHMYHDPQGLTFKLFYKHNTMFHIKPENQTCADECFFAQMCTIKNMLYEDMKECMEESISVSWPATPFPTPAVETTTALSESPAVTATPATTTTTAVPPPWRRTTTTTEDYWRSTPPAAVANNGDDVSHVENQPDPADVAEKEDHYGTGVLVGFLLVLCVALGIGGFMLYRRIHYRRFPAQESLLLTDTDFRYEGCSQNDLS